VRSPLNGTKVRQSGPRAAIIDIDDHHVLGVTATQKHLGPFRRWTGPPASALAKLAPPSAPDGPIRLATVALRCATDRRRCAVFGRARMTTLLLPWVTPATELARPTAVGGRLNGYAASSTSAARMTGRSRGSAAIPMAVLAWAPASGP
jgi:hypothetical protein